MLRSLVFALVFALPAAAQTFTVTNAIATGSGSLSATITAANAFSGAATINFNSGLTITLTAELPILKNTSGISINGNGSVLDGGSTSNTTGFRGFFIGVGIGEAAVSPGLTATTTTQWSISNLTIQNANVRHEQWHRHDQQRRTLRFDSNNAFGFSNANTGADVIVNGGTVTNSGGGYNQIQNLTLNGGTLTGVGGFAASPAQTPTLPAAACSPSTAPTRSSPRP